MLMRMIAATVLLCGAGLVRAQEPPAKPSPAAEQAPAPKKVDLSEAHEQILAASTKPAGSPLAQAAKGVFATAIADNSFFLEEAFNQEAGVVQHISSFVYLRNEGFFYNFTQEWPAPNERHQFSISIPYGSLSGTPREHGFGDVLLNYRFGAVQHPNVAFAPRVSLIFPSGSNDRGLGDGSTGVQFNLPVSHRFHENWIYHLNAGATFLPRARALTATGPVRRSINNVNLGGSIIWLAKSDFNALVETFAEIGQTIDSTGAVRRGTDVYMSPGVRWAINVGDLQIVPGFAVPIRLNHGASARGAFFYLSFEHPFGARAKKP